MNKSVLVFPFQCYIFLQTTNFTHHYCSVFPISMWPRGVNYIHVRWKIWLWIDACLRFKSHLCIDSSLYHLNSALITQVIYISGSVCVLCTQQLLFSSMIQTVINKVLLWQYFSLAYLIIFLYLLYCCYNTIVLYYKRRI